MAITAVKWDGEGYDIHLLKGEKSIPLKQKLIATRNNSNDFRGNNPPTGVTVELKAEFKGAPSNHGVTMTADGQITVADPLPTATPRLHNFIVRAVISETGSNSVDILIRIHIHETIKKIWLTPDTLTLYMGGKQRFTVLAEFDDGTFGDITNRNSTVVDNTRNHLKFLRLPGNVANITVDASTGESTAVQENVQQEVRVEIRLDAATPELPDEQQSGAIVNTKPALSRARSIARVNGIGPASFDKKVNILFLPDGFQSTERDTFNQIVDTLVKKLQTDGVTFPYNELKGSINYWRLDDADFFSSVDQNVSMLGELDITARRTSRGKLVPFPIRPAPTATSWTLENLVYVIGLPIPSDARTVADFQTLYTDTNTSGSDIASSKIKTKILNKWRELGDRKLINEKDTAFGLALNDHPRVDDDADRHALLHDRRVTSQQFKTFIAALQLGGTTVGQTWTTGKDKNLICLVGRSERSGGTKSDPIFAFTLGEATEDKLQAATGTRRGIDLVPMKLVDGSGKLVDFHPALVTTIAHECAHAFGLEDEYGGGFFLPQENRINLIHAGNVQPASEITSGLAGITDVEGIRWNLPRIKAAGILNGVPTASGSDFKVTLVGARPGDFQKDDIVRFRKRAFLTDPNLNSVALEVRESLTPDQVTVVPFQGTSVPPGEFLAGSKMIAVNTGSIAVLTAEPTTSLLHGDPFLDVDLKPGQAGFFAIKNIVVLRKNPFSERFKVTDVLANQITITPIGGATIPPLLAEAGDLLIATIPVTLSPLGNDLSLIAPIISSHIRTSRGPLNAPASNPTRTCVARANSFDLMTPTNLPGGLPKGRPKTKANIVGLYDGGNEFDCGIFHPSGLCLFRTYSGPRTSRFCQVCRYLIIDRVDPQFHKELDDIYKTEYPEP